MYVTAKGMLAPEAPATQARADLHTMAAVGLLILALGGLATVVQEVPAMQVREALAKVVRLFANDY